jgi:hypothetical protein
MGLFNKFLQIIENLVPYQGLTEYQAKTLAKLNPDKIYIENVRSLLGTTHATAVRICETAVRQGLFERRIEVKCPDGAVAASADCEAHLPETVRCWHIEDGHPEPEYLLTKDLEKATFYRLNDESTSVPYGQTA